jgi:hypothetical protein
VNDAQGSVLDPNTIQLSSTVSRSTTPSPRRAPSAAFGTIPRLTSCPLARSILSDWWPQDNNGVEAEFERTFSVRRYIVLNPIGAPPPAVGTPPPPAMSVSSISCPSAAEPEFGKRNGISRVVTSIRPRVNPTPAWPTPRSPRNSPPMALSSSPASTTWVPTSTGTRMSAPIPRPRSAASPPSPAWVTPTPRSPASPASRGIQHR